MDENETIVDGRRVTRTSSLGVSYTMQPISAWARAQIEKQVYSEAEYALPLMPMMEEKYGDPEDPVIRTREFKERPDPSLDISVTEEHVEMWDAYQAAKTKAQEEIAWRDVVYMVYDGVSFEKPVELSPQMDKEGNPIPEWLIDDAENRFLPVPEICTKSVIHYEYFTRHVISSVDEFNSIESTVRALTYGLNVEGRKLASAIEALFQLTRLKNWQTLVRLCVRSAFSEPRDEPLVV